MKAIVTILLELSSTMLSPVNAQKYKILEEQTWVQFIKINEFGKEKTINKGYVVSTDDHTLTFLKSSGKYHSKLMRDSISIGDIDFIAWKTKEKLDGRYNPNKAKTKLSSTIIGTCVGIILAFAFQRSTEEKTFLGAYQSVFGCSGPCIGPQTRSVNKPLLWLIPSGLASGYIVGHFIADGMNYSKLEIMGDSNKFQGVRDQIPLIRISFTIG